MPILEGCSIFAQPLGAGPNLISGSPSSPFPLGKSLSLQSSSGAHKYLYDNSPEWAAQLGLGPGAPTPSPSLSPSHQRAPTPTPDTSFIPKGV
jgi:hypothetical protein